LCVVSHGIR